MRESKFTEHQIVGALKQAEAGVPVKDVCRELGVSPATFYQWRSRYGGIVTGTRRPRSRAERRDQPCAPATRSANPGPRSNISVGRSRESRSARVRPSSTASPSAVSTTP